MFLYAHTGKVSNPATRLMYGSTIGCFKIGPMTGKDRKNSTMVPKKSPKRNMMPMLSTMNPMKECLVKIKAIPPKKKRVGLILVGLAKKYSARVGPMINTTPMTKRMFPMASKLESKNVMIPRMKNTTPAAVDATPYSEELVVVK